MYIVRVKHSFTDLVENKKRQEGEKFEIKDQKRVEELCAIKVGGDSIIELIGIKHPKKIKKGPFIIVHADFLYCIGGIETFIYNFVKHFKDRNITVVVKKGNLEPLLHIGQYADISMDNEKKYKCDILILSNYNSDYFISQVKAKKIYQMIHADWRGIKETPEWKDFVWAKHPDIDQVIAVSESTQQGLKETMGYDSEVIYNLLEDDIGQEDYKVFITLSRATPEKGIYRIVEMAEAFKEAGKHFIWFLCSPKEQIEPSILYKIKRIPEIILLPPKVENKGLIKNCDYLVQLSNTESFCYSAFEALQRGVPVILTDFPESKNIITPGENGYIVKRDLSDLDVELIFRRKPKNITCPQLCDYSLWEKVFKGEL